jgi:hypothetical protein
MDKAVKDAKSRGVAVARVLPKEVKESTLYAVDYNQTLWTQVGGGDVVPAIQQEAKGKKRARKGDGKYKGDDPSTPENEAWESSES